MRIRTSHILPAFLLLAAASVSAAESRPDFDQGVAVEPVVEEARRSAREIAGDRIDSGPAFQKPGDSVWISVGNEDLAALGDRFGFSRRKVLSHGANAAVFRIHTTELPLLSALMHRFFRRCGGFFAYDTWEAAEADVMAGPARGKPRNYTIDRQDVVRPMVARVGEAGITRTIEKLSSFHNRYYEADSGVASSRWIRDHWKEIAADRQDISVELFAHERWPQESVVLTITGRTEPDKVVVIGGHADSLAGWRRRDTSRAPGADDNASGIGVMTEALRVLVESGYRPAKTIKLIAYAAEEVGLRGSQKIAEAFERGGVDVLGVVQFDMTNYKGSAEDIYLISDYTDATQNAFLGRLIDEYVKVPWGYTECGYACSDHASWHRRGFAASFGFEASHNEVNPDIHTSRDTLATSGGHSRHSANFAKLAVAYLAETAK
ncbi:MAG: M20/M25/M40 family metallo-hydrolase [Elusimicrobiota bacterium]